MPKWLPYPIPLIGTLATVIVAAILYALCAAYVRRFDDARERYRRKSFFTTVTVVGAAVIIGFLWAHTLKEKGTFFGLLAAGMAVALKEPLLSAAGKLAIFSGHMFTAGDRIELQQMTGDVIDIGFFYTRMLEIGSWVHGDQYSGRLLLIPNSMIFGSPIMNYTQHLGCIWDEVSLPITYGSNMEAAVRILTDVGAEYSREFLKKAERQLAEMKKQFLVPDVEFQPNVYVKVTSNWLHLSMRYVVEPRQRRAASSYIYKEVFLRVRSRKDIQIASETMDLTVHRPQAA